MKSGSRGALAASIAIGILTALLASVAMMALLAFAIVAFDISDGLITALNQVIKISSVFVGCRVCVGKGGEKGFARGAAVGLGYMVLGYAIYCLTGTSSPNSLLLAFEFTLGALIGALSGALSANLSPGTRRKESRRENV